VRRRIGFGGDNGCMLVIIQHWKKVVLYPFLDLNNNGKKDEGENRIFVKDVKVINGRND
jgi:hypothetical protein